MTALTVLNDEQEGSYSVVIDPHGIEVQVEFSGVQWDQLGPRNAYCLHIRTRDRHYMVSDLRSGVGDAVNAEAMWATAVSFLSACAEAQEYGDDAENADLFPRWVVELVSDHLDELVMHADEITGVAALD